MRSFTRIPNDIIKQSWFTSPTTTYLYTWLSLNADGNGQITTSRADLSERTGLSERQIRTALEKLEATKYVTKLSTKLPTKFATTLTVSYLVNCRHQITKSDQVNDQVSVQVNDQPRAYKNDILLNHSIQEDNKTKNVILTDNIRKSENLSDAEVVKMIHDFFNQAVEENNARIPKARAITDQRRAMMLARIREYGIETVKEAITKAVKSDFLNGGGNRGFVADLTWIVRPNNFPKILEGLYGNNHRRNPMDIGMKFTDNNPEKYKQSW